MRRGWVGAALVALVPGGCGGLGDQPSTVRGVQIVGIESDPVEPTSFDALRLRTWVADSVPGRQADVLVWVCTPLDGRCVEAYPPGSTGLPLSFWTRVGRAAPTFDAASSWPLFASIAASQIDLPEDVRGNLVVWALACAPGVCPIVDQVAADPRSGSEAWTQVVDALANPGAWLDTLPRDQVSVAVKLVPLNLGGEPEDDTGSPFAPFVVDTGAPRGPNHGPSLGRDFAYAEGDVKVFDVFDPDLDELSFRGFVTAGGVHLEQRADELWVMHQQPRSPAGRDGVLYVVVDDGRGGTAVWSDHPAFDPCAATPSVDIALDDGDPLPVTSADGQFRVVVPWTVTSPNPLAEWTVSFGVGGAASVDVSRGLQPLAGTSGGCVTTRQTALTVPGQPDQAALCRMLGQVATLRAEVTTYDGTIREDLTRELHGVLVAGTTALESACAAL